MKEVEVGTERVSPNGYTYIKGTTGWELKHRLIAAKTLRRKLRKDEQVRFADGDRNNFDPNNLIVSVTKRKAKKKARIRKLEDKIKALQYELKGLKEDA